MKLKMEFSVEESGEDASELLDSEVSAIRHYDEASLTLSMFHISFTVTLHCMLLFLLSNTSEPERPEAIRRSNKGVLYTYSFTGLQ